MIGVDAQTQNSFLAMPDDLIAFRSTQGHRLLEESKAKESCWLLAQFYTT